MGTIVVGAIVLCVCGLALASLRKTKKATGCSGGCPGCSSAQGCSAKE